jgi:signal transduction histidine kinase
VKRPSRRSTRGKRETPLESAARDLAEARERAAATAQVLRVIAGSPAGVQPAFDAIARAATELCEADLAGVFRFDGQLIHFVAQHGRTPDEIEAAQRAFPQPPSRSSVPARALLAAGIVQIADVAADPDADDSLRMFRTVLSVPMLRDGRPLGAITVARRVVRPFTDGQVALLQTFAEQAVIAIENVRLFNELETSNRELTIALEQQTATSEILRVMSSSPTDVQPVLEAVAERAARLCAAADALLLRVDGTTMRRVAHFGAITSVSPPRPVTGDTPTGRAALERRTIHVEDILEAFDRGEYLEARWLQQGSGFRTVLAVPLLREQAVIGVLTIRRLEVRGFTPEQIALVTTFADQAAIAIENVRLFNELETSNRELTTALERQTATSEILRVISSSPTDVQPVFDAIVTSAGRLCGAESAAVLRFEDDRAHFVASYNFSPGTVEMYRRRFPRPLAETDYLSRVTDGSVVNIPDIEQAGDASAEFRAIYRARGVRSVVWVPMVRAGRAIGVISVAHHDVAAFSDARVQLLRTFADQAVIAVENARLFHEIEDKSHQLEVASRHKSEFLANMSHELRTPLNAILGFSEVLADGMFGEINDKQAEYLADILESGRHLLSLINDILDLSKIEAGRMELDAAEFDLPDAVENALVLVRERASRRGIALERRIDERLGTIHADQRKVKQVLLNLLSNALKFTPEGGRIDVGAVVNGTMAEISVADTGVGIAPGDQEAVFEEFRQVGAASKKVEGTGLGLALARKFIELHGGRIWVESKLGAGSTFTFSLPLGGRGTSSA